MRTIRFQKGRPQLHRVHQLTYVMALLFFLVLGRVAHLHLSSRAHVEKKEDRLQRLATRQYSSKLRLSPYRGDIRDRSGVALAISIRKESLAINPRTAALDTKTRKRLEALLSKRLTHLERHKRQGRHFSWLKRKVEPHVSKQVEQWLPKGLYKLDEPDRFYIAPRQFAHILGHVNIDDQGSSGLEALENERLKGKTSYFTIRKDARNQPMILEPDRTNLKHGQDITTTLDLRIQQIVYEALKKGKADAKAEAAFAVVTDPYNGDILAYVNIPTFDPGDRATFTPQHMRNRIALDLLEPGSTLKPLVAALAMDKGSWGLEEPIDCEKGKLNFPGRAALHDDHPESSLSFSETLVYSNNICTYKIAQSLGAKALTSGLKRLGFTQKQMTLGLPGERPGRISSPKHWSPIRFANVAIGQGLHVKTLEMIAAYGAIANGGLLIVPRITQHPEHANPIAKQVLSKHTADSIKTTLRDVVRFGTGQRAKPKSFTAAGKTGTAEKWDSDLKQYSKSKRLATFIGFAPAQTPRIAVYVVIDEPGQRPYYGGRWAGPVFADIAEQVLHYLQDAPARPKLTRK